MKKWLAKFGHAFRGIGIGSREPSFLVHIPAAAFVICSAWWLNCDRVEWTLLVLCIGTVISAELFNTAIEQLARSVSKENDEHIRNALDVAAGAVLISSVTATVVGAIVLIRKLMM